MSYIQEITQLQSTSGASSSTKKDKTDDIMGKEDFLTLLVAQLKNQDPLNPDDPTEFTSQLAQFSSLEQLTNLNESMENMAASNANSDRFATLQTIGKNVIYQDSSFSYNGEEGAQLGYKLDGVASEVTLSIKRNGSVIKTLTGTELSTGNHILNWDGLTESGTVADRGEYTISVSVQTAEGTSIAASPLIQSEVTGVDLTGEFGGTLETQAGTVSFSSILGVYENNSASI
jgi:flagellar basal-body rod modification protein FlgD